MSANVYDALDEAKKKLYTYFQQLDELNTKHIKNIKDLVATIEHYGGSICEDPGLLAHEKEESPSKTDKEIKVIVRGRVLGCMCIKRANAERFKKLLKNLRTQYSYRQDLYPDTMEQAHDMLNKHELLNTKKKKHDYKKKGKGKYGRGTRFQTSQQFAQQGSEQLVAGDDGR